MDPATTAMLIAAGVRSLKALMKDSSSPSTTLWCDRCNNVISGEYYIMKCCRRDLCLSCFAKYLNEGGQTCPCRRG